jgi:hypothetical protein
MVPSRKKDRDLLRQTDAVRRSIERTTEPRRQLERLGGYGYLDQVERFRQQIEGPATRALETVDRANRIIEGPNRTLQRYTDDLRRATESPAKRIFTLLDQASKAAEAPTRNVADFLERTRLAVEGPAQQMHRQYERLNQLLERYDFQRVLDQAAELGARVETAIRDSLPDNWQSISISDSDKVERLVRIEGVPLVWVPGRDLTSKLVQAKTREEAMALLLSEQEAVLEDAEAVLGEVTEPDFSVLVSKAQKAIEALRDGHGDAAQALAAAIFTSTIHDGLQHARFEDLRDEAKKNHPHEASFAGYRRALVLQLAARFVQGVQWAQPGFNRSTTLHQVSQSEYTPENNLAAVMAAVGVLREAQAHREEGITATASTSP